MSYDFSIAAINGIGEGLSSTIVSAIPLPGVPSQPKNLIATINNDNEVYLSWQVPDSSGLSAITDYVIEYKIHSDTDWISFTDGVSLDTFVNVDNLMNGVMYDFRVSAMNNSGTGPASLISKQALSITPLPPTASAISISGIALI